MSQLSDNVKAANAALQKSLSVALATKQFGQAVTDWVLATDPVTPPPPPPPPPATGTAGRVGFAVDMGGGWADGYVANTAYRAKLLAQWDRALSWLPSMTAWYPRAWEYIDSVSIYPGQTQFDSLILRDSAGNKLWMSGYVGEEYAADISKQAWRDNIVARAKASVTKGFLGVHLDDVNQMPSFNNGTTAATPAGWDPVKYRENICLLVEAVRQAIPTAEIVHNPVWYESDNHLGADTFSQRQFAAADVVMYERGFNDNGIHVGTDEWSFDRYMKHMDNVHKAGAKVWLMSHAASTDAQGAKFNLGGALLVSEGGDFQFHHYGSNPDSFWSGHSVDLGAAKGPRYGAGTNILQRDFDKGVVRVDFAARTATIPGVA